MLLLSTCAKFRYSSFLLLLQVPLGSAVGFVSIHPGTSLCGVSCDDWGIRVVDVEVGRIVRRFKGHEDRVTCMTMASDGKWLISSSMDGTIRIWDIPASRVFQVRTAVYLAELQDACISIHSKKHVDCIC